MFTKGNYPVWKSRHNLVFDAGKGPSYLILNPLSGAVDLFDSLALSLLGSADTQTEARYGDFYGYCRERGYLYDSAADEQLALHNAHDRAKERYSREPLRVEVYPTFLCNLRCTYCFQDHRLHGGNSLIEPEVVDSLFKAVSELAQRRDKAHLPVLTLFGGEPLLNRRAQKEAIERVLRIGAQKGYHLRVVTNGVELAGYADVLARYGVEFVQVTLDGPQRIHDSQRVFADGTGSFARVVEGVDRALAKGVPVAVRVNVNAQSVQSLPELAAFITEEGWIEEGLQVGVAPVDEFVPETEWCAQQAQIETLKRLLNIKRSCPQTAFMSISYHLAEFFQHIVEKGRLPLPAFRHCPAAMGNQVSLDFRGDVFACCCMNCCHGQGFRLGRFHPRFEIDEAVLQAWTSRDVTQLAACKDCPVALVCGGGCGRVVSTRGGDLRVDVACPPTANLPDLQVLIDYYLPMILERRKTAV